MGGDHHRLSSEGKVSDFYRILLLFFILLLAPVMKAQYTSTFFQMHQSAQANALNPALQPRCKIFIGIPALNSIQIGYNNNIFSYNDLVDGDNLALDDVFDGMRRINLLTTDVHLSILSVGYKHEKDYFTFSVSDRLFAAASFSRRLADVLLYGNEQFTGQTINLRHTRAGAAYYREYAAGWSYRWDEFTSLGVRGKLLFGKANGHTGRSRLQIDTDNETYALALSGDVGLDLAFPVTFTEDANGLINGADLQDIQVRSFLLNPRNPGLAFDLGVIYQYSNDITLSASILDLGAVFWTDQRNNIDAAVDYSYDGIQEADFTGAAFVLDIYDSIYDNATFSLSQERYLTFLPATIFAGGTYRWKKYLDIGITARARIINRTIQPAITASAISSPTKWLQASVSWSYMNNSLKNAGAAIAYTGRGFQFYLASDNVMGYLLPYGTRTLDLRFGMNLMLGCPGSRIVRLSEPDRNMVPCPPGQKQRKRNRYR